MTFINQWTFVIPLQLQLFPCHTVAAHIFPPFRVAFPPCSMITAVSRFFQQKVLTSEAKGKRGSTLSGPTPVRLGGTRIKTGVERARST